MINIETLKNDIGTLCAHPDRAIGSPGRIKAKEYIKHRLKMLKAASYNDGVDDPGLKYANGPIEFENIMVRIPGRGSRNRPFLVGAHYDTVRGCPGAIDNAAAVAVLFYVIEAIKPGMLDRDLIVGFFDAEEPPFFQSDFMGSTYFYRHQRKQDDAIACAVILDLIGHNIHLPLGMLRDTFFITGMETHQAFEPMLNSVELADEHSFIPITNAYMGDLSDQYVFNMNNIPFLMITSGVNKEYHLPTDTPACVDYKILKNASRLLMKILKKTGMSQEIDSPKNEAYDPIATELKFTMSKVHPWILRLLGVTRTSSREDLAKVAMKLRNFIRRNH